MKDKLEDFIQRNRAQFDDETPGAGVWKGIARSLPPRRNQYQWIWQAAAVLFFATSSWLFLDRLESPAAGNQANVEAFPQVEDFYFREISQRRELILDLSESGVSAEAELQKLDAMYLVLKEQLRENPSEEVVEALTLNLIVRLDLLNQVVAEIEEDATQDNAPGKDDSQIQAEI